MPRRGDSIKALAGSLAAGLVLVCCGSTGGAPVWALQHGTLDVSLSGLSGVQVWEFYASGWERAHSERFHVCARVQSLTASEVTDSLDGCLACEVVVDVTTVELETDCDGAVADAGTFGGVVNFAFGPVPDDVADIDPYPGDSLGWYASWDGESLEPIGFAWDQGLDTGEARATGGEWTTGTRYVLWPAYAWEL